MFVILKLALVTSAFYIGIALILEVALWVAATKTGGGVLYTLNPLMWGLGCGVTWLISFALAWRVFMIPFIASFPRPPLK